MSDPFANKGVPRGALLSMAALILFSVVSVLAVRVGGYSAHQPIEAAATESRDLRFVDTGGGEVTVYDWSTKKIIATFDPGTENFIRGILRGLARERRGMGAGDLAPFRVSILADGRVTLEDRATGRTLLLEAFGATNAHAFRKLLEPDGARRDG